MGVVNVDMRQTEGPCHSILEECSLIGHRVGQKCQDRVMGNVDNHVEDQTISHCA